MRSESFLLWLLSQSWQASLLVGILLLLKKLIGPRLSPRWHHALWFLVLARLLMPAGPASFLSIQNIYQPTWLAADKHLAAHEFRGRIPFSKVESVNPVTPEVSPADTALEQNHFHYSYASILLAIWAVGVVVLLLATLRRANQLRRLVSKASPVVDTSVHLQLRHCRQTLHISRAIELRQTAALGAPIVVGLLKPIILLPASFTQNFTQAEILQVLMHECVHVRRNDLLTGWVVALLQAVHWFNPVLWYGFAQMRLDREMACDAEVLRTCESAMSASYGRTLLKVAEQLGNSLPKYAAIGVVEKKSRMRRRIEMILHYRTESAKDTIVAAFVALALALVSYTSAETQNKNDASPPPAQPPTETPAPPNTEASETSWTLISKQKPFKLTVEPQTGALEYRFNAQHELESMHATKSVVFATGETTITAAALDYNLKKNEIVTTGPGLRVQQPMFEYFGNVFRLTTNDNHAQLEGDATIVSKLPDGSQRVTKGDRIEIFHLGPKPQFKVSGSRGFSAVTYENRPSVVMREE